MEIGTGVVLPWPSRGSRLVSGLASVMQPPVAAPLLANSPANNRLFFHAIRPCCCFLQSVRVLPCGSALNGGICGFPRYPCWFVCRSRTRRTLCPAQHPSFCSSAVRSLLLVPLGCTSASKWMRFGPVRRHFGRLFRRWIASMHLVFAGILIATGFT